uniref:VHS domain-containing protein n=1 Tax=Acanthochromis polyacanthus TaxID=80966 RepID=A0A3Q1F0W5_9TELE
MKHCVFAFADKATNPSNRQEDWEYIMGFCDQINNELEGPQISIRLLAYKIQSPQEWEAMQALTVLEACMKNCGRRFHNEVGKFKFLNELIKVVSPKYLGDKVSEKVKKKVIELLYSWTVSLPDEAKICEAYQMLKSQGKSCTTWKQTVFITFDYILKLEKHSENAVLRQDCSVLVSFPAAEVFKNICGFRL